MLMLSIHNRIKNHHTQLEIGRKILTCLTWLIKKPEIVVFQIDILMFWYWVASILTRYQYAEILIPDKSYSLRSGDWILTIEKLLFYFLPEEWITVYLLFCSPSCYWIVWGWREAFKRGKVSKQDEQILDVTGGDSGVGSEHLS